MLECWNKFANQIWSRMEYLQTSSTWQSKEYGVGVGGLAHGFACMRIHTKRQKPASSSSMEPDQPLGMVIHS